MSAGPWTRGPWRVENDGSGRADIAARLVLVAQSVRERDAYLIAAAPDLYEALERMLAVFREQNEHVSRESERAAVTAARAALLRARGGGTS